MTAAAPRLAIDEQNPWPGLSAFDEAAQRFFNGRQEESAALRRLVMQMPLTVLFAASGLGKTSLVQAGLFPLLRRDSLPVYVRLDLKESDPRESAPLIDQAKAAMQAEISRRHVDAPAFRSDESLWEYLHRAGLEFWSEDNRLLAPLFVFDQFEEVFTLGAGNAAAVARLRSDLADLIENRIPASLASRVPENEPVDAGLALESQRYKVLLSFREDFLAAMEGWKLEIPSLMRNRLRLLPMSGEQAFEAVHRTAPLLAPEPIARRIVSFVAAAGEDSGESTAGLEVAPALLSLVCHGLNERRKQQGKAQFDEALLTGTGQTIVADFYRNAVAGLGEPVRRFIERELITERGFRKPCDVDDARTVHGVTDKDLALLVDRRVLHIEPARGTERVELTHDLLTRVVREERGRRREHDKRRREVRRRLTLAGIALGVIAIVMTVLYFRVNEQKHVAAVERARANKQAAVAKAMSALAEEARQQRDAAEKATKDAESATRKADREAHAALSHQLAGAAINAKGSARSILFALHALAAAQDADEAVLRDAEEALRQSVDAMHQTAAAAGTELKRPGHDGWVDRIVFSPEGSRVATWGGDGVRVWDVGQQDEILSLPKCSILEFSTDGKRLACGNPPFGDFLDLETGRSIVPQVGSRGRRGPGYDLRQMGFSPDGKLMLWGSPEETNVVDGGSFTKKFPGQKAVFSPDGKTLATIGAKAVKLWDIRSGSELQTWQGDAERVVFSGDGKRLAIAPAGHSPVQLWDSTSAKSTPLGVRYGGGCFALNYDGTRLVASVETFRLEVVDTTGEGLATLASLEGRHFDACQSATDGRSVTLQSFSHEDTGNSWENFMWDLSAATPSRIRSASGFDSTEIVDLRSKTKTILPAQDKQKLQAVAFSPDGTRMVTSASDGRARIWDTTTGRRLLTLVGHEQPILTAAYSPDGSRIVTAGLGQVAKLWDAHTGRFQHDLNAQTDRVLAVTFSPDSSRVVTAGNGNVMVWNAVTGAVLTVDAPTGRLDGFGASFSADGKRFALFGTQASILDAASFREILRVQGNLESVGGTAITRDGKFLAVAQSDGVHLWRQGSGWKPLSGSAGGQRSAQITFAFSRDGRRLVTPGTGNTIRIFDTAINEESATLYYGNKDVKIKGVAFSADGQQIYAAGDDWSVYRFVTPLEDLNAEARRLAIEAKASLTDDDCAKYLHQRPCPAQLRRIP